MQIQRLCLVCGTTFKVSPSILKYSAAKYCGKECQFAYMRGENSPFWKEKPARICKGCGVEFKVENWRLKNSGRGKYCTKKCLIEHRVGENSTNWQGGIDKVNRRIRGRKEILAWRRAVLERDGYKCVHCGATEKLETDHIKSFALYPALRADINNGRTLCRPCHIKTFTKRVK